MADIEDILLALEKSNLVPSAFVARLRMEVTKSPPPHDPKLLIKFLVDKGHITPAQGERLLLAPKTVLPPKSEQDEYINLDDDLGLAPLDEPSARSQPAGPPPIPVPKAGGSSMQIKKLPPEAARPVPVPVEKVYDLEEVVEDQELTESDVVTEQLEVSSDEDEMLVNKRAQRRSVWDSPLLVLGGGGLALLLIVVGALLWSIFRASGEDAFRVAESDYKNGAYTQAIEKIDAYLADYSSHKDVSKARVMRGLSQIRQHVEGSRNLTAALETARTTLNEISGEEAFPQFRAELAGLLPDIAVGLAARAAEKPNKDLIAQSNEALSLVKQYVPAAIRNEERLTAVADSLDVTRRTLAREARLAATIAEINKVAERLASISAEELPTQLEIAYDARQELLKEYPKLVDEGQLAAAMKRVSQAEIGAVQPFELSRDATTDEATSPVRSTLSLVTRTSAGTGGSEPTSVVFAMTPGGLTGLNAQTGEPLWRRPMGRGTYLAPMLLTGAHVGDALIADTARRELLRIEIATGKLRWRQSWEETFSAAPTLFGTEVLLATHSGKLYRIELQSGRIAGGWQLPQGLDTSPSVDARKKLVYQLGSHSNLYVLSPETPVCREVLYLGHETGSIIVAPTAVSRYLIVGENIGLKDSQLRVILADEAGLQLAVQQTETLGGHVDTPLAVEGRMLHAVTDRGGIFSFEIAAPGQGKPLSQLAQRAATLEEPLTHFSLVKDGRVWVAGEELSRYGIQSTSAKLAPDGVTLQNSVFLQPLQVSGDSLLLVRRPRSGWGATAMAMRPSGRETLWETRLAMPSLGGVSLASDGQAMILLDASGGVFRIAPAELGRGGIASAVSTIATWPEAVDPAALQSPPLQLDDGSLIWAVEPNATRLLQLAPDGASRWIALPEPLTSAPERFRSGIALTGQEGRVYVIDPAREGNLLEPYQPRAAADQSLRRFGPTMVDENHLLTADAEGKLSLLVVKDDPKPHLEIEKDVTLTEPIAGVPIVLGNMAFAMNARDAFAAFELPALEQVQTWSQSGQPLWGPQRVGECVMLVTPANELWCWNAAGEQTWKLPLVHGPLAAAPLVRPDGYVLVTRSGAIVRIGSDGAEAAHVETGLSFQGAGLVVGQHVVAPDSDGAVHLIPLP